MKTERKGNKSKKNPCQGTWWSLEYVDCERHCGFISELVFEYAIFSLYLVAGPRAHE
jgi:hypothetical protein